jgi:hypothetical protein
MNQQQQQKVASPSIDIASGGSTAQHVTYLINSGWKYLFMFHLRTGSYSSMWCEQ